MFLVDILYNINLLYAWSILIICIIISAIIYNFYVRLTCGKFEDKNVNLDGKTILITGANSGLGKETAKFMAKRGGRIIMACRNMERALEAQEEIIAESENLNVIVHQLDLSSFESIRKFATKIIETEPRLDILIHNAAYSGTLYKRKAKSGIELTMAINLYGPFLLTHLLIDLLRKSAPSKIVMIGSKAHKLCHFNPNMEEDLNPIKFWPPVLLYSKSKFACFLFIYELARRLKGSGVTANILHPGTCDSPIWDRTPFPWNILSYISRKFMKTVQQGIQTILYVSLSSEVHNVTGHYFRDCKIVKSHRKTYNAEWQRKLWMESSKIVQIENEDAKL